MKKSSERLGVCDQIQTHSFFDPIDFQLLENRAIEPPFKPNIVSISMMLR